MEQIYHIQWNPERRMNGAGFTIALYPKWKELVSKSDLDQERVDRIIEQFKPFWIKGHPQSCNDHYPKVNWGEYGCQNISVEGNACGLDLGSSFGVPDSDAALLPHNVDTIQQASLILTVFSKIADYMIFEEWGRNNNN